jgi:hypothetical protein
MWLEDSEIRQKLDSESAEEITEAIRSIQMRWEGGDQLEGIEPLSAEILRAYPGQIPTDVLNSFLSFLLGVEGVPHPTKSQAYAEIAKAVAYFIDTTGQYAVALSLKVDKNPVETVNETLNHLGFLLSKVDENRIPDIEFFISCLLDGKPEIRAATLSELATWPENNNTRQLIHNIATELTDDECSFLAQARGKTN